MLRVDGLTARYGPVVAVRDLSLEVTEGQVVALLGPNGAGKTTTLSAVMGLVPPAAGQVHFEDRDLTALGPEDTVRAGIALAPEGRRILRTLTVLENLELGATFRTDRAAVARDLDGLLQRFPVLGDRRTQLAGTLSGGEAQQLAIARALMARPRLLLLDEPTLGLAPQLVDRVFEIVEELRREGLTVVLVDQNATRAMTLADRTYVLRQGQVVTSGTSAEIGGAEGLAEAYLGRQVPGGHHV
jgi:branched-chain amino acid transport system ATP-binding protein